MFKCLADGAAVPRPGKRYALEVQLANFPGGCRQNWRGVDETWRELLGRNVDAEEHQNRQDNRRLLRHVLLRRAPMGRARSSGGNCASAAAEKVSAEGDLMLQQAGGGVMVRELGGLIVLSLLVAGPHPRAQNKTIVPDLKALAGGNGGAIPGWEVLRNTRPSHYEKPIVPAPDGDAWFHVRIVVEKPRVSVSVNNSQEPSLVVDELSDRKGGGFGLWVGPGLGGYISSLKITAHD